MPEMQTPGAVVPPGAAEWIQRCVEPTAPIEAVHVRPWASVWRVPVADDVVWFKVCAHVQNFEPRLTAMLSTRWPDRVSEVLAYDVDRAWLLLADAGTPTVQLGNPPQAWLSALPLYAELQRGEAEHAPAHLAHGVPDIRLPALPTLYARLLERDLPLEPDEIERLRTFGPRLEQLSHELAACGLPDSVQHDDLHAANLYLKDQRTRILDWGDSSISHPFASLVVTFRFLEEINGFSQGDAWFARLRDAYLEPWGSGFQGTFALAMRVGAFAHVCAWVRQRDALPQSAIPQFDRAFAIILRRALVQIDESRTAAAGGCS
jgi:Phosphotransferase enzyme family